MYRLLLDQAQAPLPDAAIFDIGETGFASMLAPEDYSQFRARGFLYPGPASKVEEFYRKLWPDFHFQTNPGGEYDYDPDTKTTVPVKGGVAIFRWKGSTLTFSPEPFPPGFMERGAGEPAEKSPLKGAFTLWVSESSNLKEGRRGPIWDKLPADFSGERACDIQWINFRAFGGGISLPTPQN
jgi:hypothetical protein